MASRPRPAGGILGHTVEQTRWTNEFLQNFLNILEMYKYYNENSEKLVNVMWSLWCTLNGMWSQCFKYVVGLYVYAHAMLYNKYN